MWRGLRAQVRGSLAFPAWACFFPGQNPPVYWELRQNSDLCPALAAGSQDPMTPVPLLLRGSLIPGDVALEGDSCWQAGSCHAPFKTLLKRL